MSTVHCIKHDACDECQTALLSAYWYFACAVGVYGDQVNEMSWAIGEVLNVIRELHLEENTLALFFSDHGPHLEICEEGGSPGPFRGLKLGSL